jgi:hypothetical protein
MSSDDSEQGGWGECSLDTCPIEWSVFQYQPNLAANALFIAIFGTSMLVHLYQGYRWKQWTFAGLVALGCASEMIGYGGRLIMHDDPWSFEGFMLQISELYFRDHVGCERFDPGLLADDESISLHHLRARVHERRHLHYSLQEVGSCLTDIFSHCR